MFKRGEVQESFELLDRLLDEVRAKVAAGTPNAVYELLESLIVQSRLRMEVGEFPRVDWRLIEAKNILKT